MCVEIERQSYRFVKIKWMDIHITLKKKKRDK